MTTDLVRSIEEMLDGLNDGKTIEISDEQLTWLSTQLATTIKESLSGREHKVRPKDRLAPTEIGETCLRKVWYSRHPELSKPERLPGHTYLKFMYGNVLETVLLLLAKVAGHEIQKEQEVVELPIEGITVRGRLDAVINGVLVDVKTSSNYGFSKFTEGLTDDNDKFGYRGQLEAYQASTGIDQAGFFAINKETGRLAFHMHSTSAEDALRNTEARVKYLSTALNNEEVPEFQPEFAAVPHGKKNSKLCTKCSYCGYKYECWKDANEGEGLKGYKYSNGPVWLTHIGEEPRVPQIVWIT